MTKAHIPGYPRIGGKRELKQALEGYWRGEIDAAQLEGIAADIKRANWQAQAAAGLDFVAVGDFSLYDHVLDTSALLGVVPPRFGTSGRTVPLDTYFRMARGRGRAGDAGETYACEMTKWFDTNYHYLVPEFEPGQRFALASTRLLDDVEKALAGGFTPKPVLLGPLTYLWLGKAHAGDFDRLRLLDGLLPVYGEVLARLRALGVEWVQLDEPALVMDLPQSWKQAYESAYTRLQAAGLKVLLAVYFDALGDNLSLAVRLPTAGLHADCVRAPGELDTVLDQLPPYKVLSAGVVDGRNIWRNDLNRSLELLAGARERLGDRLWVGSSCSLLHSPVDLEAETALDERIRPWLAFARQKLDEIGILKTALVEGEARVAPELEESRRIQRDRRDSLLVRRAEVQESAAALGPEMARRNSAYQARAARQRRHLGLPPLPTTTIGSFPQTAAIRKQRRAYKRGEIDEAEYTRRMCDEIRHAVEKQESLGLDVLVHGEPERNDMVEYFGEWLEGVAVTRNGWVQSYGSRCVKPPIVYGDVARPRPMTVEWARYAQSLTAKPVKGMLTGPVTLLHWSFVRDDQPRRSTAEQLALALREEVGDLEAAGIRIIQIDEPALREGLPLRRERHREYLDWAVNAFRIAAGGAADETQIHTHMCYSEFNDIIEHIAALDADVITIETSRSRMELLEAFHDFEYPNEIGPGVYDIHSPRTPAVSEMVTLLSRAARLIPPERLWINPDCGLKTRAWEEVEPALANMVRAARDLRRELAPKAEAV